MIKCIYCGEENEPIFTYCLGCGKPLEQSISSFRPKVVSPQREGALRLVAIRADGGIGQEYPLRPGVNTIGRKGPEVVVSDDPRIADQHAMIEVGDNLVFLRDLGSRYGTFVRVRDERVVGHGDQLRIGHALFMFELKGSKPRPAADGSMWLGSASLMGEHFGRLLRLGPEDTVVEAFLLTKPEVMIGRTVGDILLSDDPFVSARHAVIYRRGDGWLLRDAGSTNGCYLRVRDRISLEDGDHILLGHHVFRLQRIKD